MEILLCFILFYSIKGTHAYVPEALRSPELSQLMVTFLLSPVVMECATAWTSVRPNIRDTLARARLASPPPTLTLSLAEAEEAGTCSFTKEGGRMRETPSVMT